MAEQRQRDAGREPAESGRVRPDGRWIDLGMSVLRKQGLHERSVVTAALEVVLPAFGHELLAELDQNAQLRADLGEARRLVTMLLEYGTEGLDYDTLPDWARGKQW